MIGKFRSVSAPDVEMRNILEPMAIEGFWEAQLILAGQESDATKWRDMYMSNPGRQSPFVSTPSRFLPSLQPGTLGLDLFKNEMAHRRDCDATENQKIPAGDAPSDGEKARLGDCEAENDYYGIRGKKVDFIRARYCAVLTENLQVLTMIYANGKGVHRNYPLATAFACQLNFNPYRDSPVAKILEMQKETSPKDFDFCDFASWRGEEGQCAAIAGAREEARKARDEEKFSKAWNKKTRLAFALLKSKLNKFTQAENDWLGDLGAPIDIARFQEHLEDIEVNGPPATTESRFTTIDRELNVAFEKALSGDNPRIIVPKEGLANYQNKLRDFEREWIKFRDAWVTFGMARYPNSRVIDWKTLITADRIDFLNTNEIDGSQKSGAFDSSIHASPRLKDDLKLLQEPKPSEKDFE